MLVFYYKSFSSFISSLLLGRDSCDYTSLSSSSSHVVSVFIWLVSDYRQHVWW